MANRERRNPHDQGGDWFVDTTCIDADGPLPRPVRHPRFAAGCDVARQVAPGLIEEADALG